MNAVEREDNLIFDYLAAVERGDIQGRVNIRVVMHCLLGECPRFESATSRYRQEDAAFVRAKYAEVGR